MMCYTFVELCNLYEPDVCVWMVIVILVRLRFLSPQEVDLGVKKVILL